MHKILIYAAYGWLTFGGIMHLFVDVVLQYLRKVRLPGAETTLYWGLNTAYGLGQIIFGLFALFVARYAFEVLEQWPAITLSFLAAVAWLVFGLFFIEYREPKIIISIFIILLIAATMSGNSAYR
ncbi:hypothetical protein [Desulfosporosinus sp. BG]|uniref:hypothetical protein n=1 Tax=Desulfosporosinus sp. BG TaxID=1633135 RepID=UPI00083B81F1|nr:hypothetical protein [Desulfosporosinus sp. BG]ODA40027.1 hypothetical protein DSBG_3233 [Desulfosporosinus sp. BG]